MKALQKAYNIKDFIWSIFRACNAVTSTVLINSWHNIWPDLDNLETENDSVLTELDEQPLINDLVSIVNQFENCNREDVVNWLNCDQSTPVYSNFTDAEIINAVLNPESAIEIDSDSSDSSESVIVEENKMTADQAIQSVGKLIAYLDTKTFITEQEILSLNLLQDKLIKENRKTKTDHYGSKHIYKVIASTYM